MKLNIGCGKDKIDGFEGLDISNFGQKYIIDLEKDGLKQFNDRSIEEIRAWNVLEHISQDRILFIMNECHRALESGGILDIIVPHAMSAAMFSDPTHKSYNWTTRTFREYFAGKRPRNATYYDHTGKEMQKWAIESNQEGYTWEVTNKFIHVRLIK